MAKPWMPGGSEIVREAIIVAAGALLAALVVRYVVPAEYRAYFSLTGQ